MKVIEEKNGYKIGINENPDVAHLEETRRYQLQFPDESRVSGRRQTIEKLFARLTSE
jgi:hypothetical protein